ncbi:hypothetical protein F5148DRAFT_1286684 [Russula earlei]|uniref:Uncharacterized protein n=1 Tax=Russula earlei TaxID=71964 RepID=A0ACC0U3D8_9AGAM|nr:hypothetical protein F5148DRAFT_1286684 [Russula earlei]
MEFEKSPLLPRLGQLQSICFVSSDDPVPVDPDPGPSDCGGFPGWKTSILRDDHFYRDQLASDIRAEPSTSAAERKAMMDLPKRFEEGGLDDPFAYPDDDVITSSGGWPASTLRSAPVVASPASELAKTLLNSPDLADDILTPWWVTSSNAPQVNASVSGATRLSDLMVIPESLLAAPTISLSAPSFLLAYNLVAIMTLTRLARGAITSAAFARFLLRDAAPTLLRPPLVVENDEPSLALRALSDLHALFKPRAPRAAAKVVFYAAQVHRGRAPLLCSLAADAERRAMKLAKEATMSKVKGKDTTRAERMEGPNSTCRPTSNGAHS